MPTGLCPNTGKILFGDAIKSSYTFSIGLKKVGILQDAAVPYVGKIIDIDIDISQKQLSKSSKVYLGVKNKDIESIKLFLPPKNASKYQRGRTLLVTGSEKYYGAAYLVINGALSSGVGSVKVLVPEGIAKSIWKVAPEVVVDDSLGISKEGNSILYESLKQLDLNRFDSIVIGPGIGVDILDWEKCISYLIKFKGILILDADALNRIAKSKTGCQFFLNRHSQTWITPHIFEFQRLFPDLYGSNNIELAISAASKFNIGILLKGAHSIITEGDSVAWQLYETDDNSARAGLGDLLSGFIAGMAASEMSSGKKITTESLAKYTLIHSYAACHNANGSNASLIGSELSKIVRQIKTGQMS